MVHTLFSSQWPGRPPTVDEGRLPFCSRCGTVSLRSGRVILHGHGLRWRWVVLPPVRKKGRVRQVRCWVRRYRCTACGCCHSVLPEGVLPRYNYGLAVMVAAWLAAAPRPLGQGEAELAVWALLGLDRPRPERHRSGASRWRSLSRWAQRIPSWWPGRSASGSTWRQRVASLLAGFTVEARSAELEQVVATALGAHAAWGAAM